MALGDRFAGSKRRNEREEVKIYSNCVLSAIQKVDWAGVATSPPKLSYRNLCRAIAVR